MKPIVLSHILRGGFHLLLIYFAVVASFVIIRMLASAETYKDAANSGKKGTVVE